MRHLRQHDGVQLMPDVRSSMIARVEHDASTRELSITFTSGKTYIYYDVPRKTYSELLAADSKGSYFLACIKDCYPYAESRMPRRSSRRS
jgi:hypothetical protein